MDENIEKKPKRPRIGEGRPAMDENEMTTTRVENADYNRETQVPENAGEGYQEGGYQHRN